MPTSSESPVWMDGDKIDEVLFCEEFRAEHPMLCIHESFFTVDGKVTDESRIKNAIYEKIKPYVRRGLSRKITGLLDALRKECYSPPLPIYHDRIHVANGTLFLDGRFEESKDFCLNRLPVRYNPEAASPARWLQFLSELLIPEDILTLQEFMGYCLIPSTKAQKMLMLVGKGGEGKPRIGIVLSALLGSNMYSGSIAKVETSPFARADLEYGMSGDISGFIPCFSEARRYASMDGTDNSGQCSFLDGCHVLTARGNIKIHPRSVKRGCFFCRKEIRGTRRRLHRPALSETVNRIYQNVGDHRKPWERPRNRATRWML